MAERAYREAGDAYAALPAAAAYRIYGRSQRRRHKGRSGRSRRNYGCDHRQRHTYVHRGNDNGPSRRSLHQILGRDGQGAYQARLRDAGGQLLPRHHSDAAGHSRLSAHRARGVLAHGGDKQRGQLDAGPQAESSAGRAGRSCQGSVSQQCRQSRHNDSAGH